DVLGDLADDRVLDADHVPVVDRDPAQIALGLAEGQIGREGGGDAERGEGAAALEEGAAALGGGELAGHALLPDFLVDVTDTIRGVRPQGPRPEARPRAAFRRAAASFRPTRSPRDSGRIRMAGAAGGRCTVYGRLYE